MHELLLDKALWSAETLYLRQARDGSILISVYQDAETGKLQVPADVASNPEETMRVGMQVSFHRYNFCGDAFSRISTVGCARMSTVGIYHKMMAL